MALRALQHRERSSADRPLAHPAHPMGALAERAGLKEAERQCHALQGRHRELQARQPATWVT